MKNAGIVFLLLLMATIAVAQGPPRPQPGQVNQPKQQPVQQAKPTNTAAIKKASLKPEVVAVLASIEAKMIRVDSGSFIMGCPDEKDTSCYYWERPAHKVSLRTYYICKTPVTQREWQTIMNDKPWFTDDCAECPVQNISWYDALVFMGKLNRLSDRNYRFPTEAEWEFAARGGNKSKGFKYAGSNNINEVAWYDNNSGKKTHPVMQKKPNELGLYDMCGNVWQWCYDWFDDKYYETSPAENPKGPDKGELRDCRGGSWWSTANDSRVINRDRYAPDARDDDVGFRLVHN